MKKYLGCLVVMMLAVFILSACGGGRDLSTPSSRLVGHWRTINTPSMSEYYFGEIDKETGEGTFAEYGITSGKIYKDTYKVISETPDGEDITITVLPFEDIHTSINIAKDGLTANLMDFTIEYIDDKTEYEP